MVQEEQFQSNSNSAAAGSRSSKKLKQKKIPQRGLGVAQLEKIRLEEQQKKDAAAVAVVPSSPCVVVPLPPGPPLNPYQSQSSIPFQSSPADLSSSSSLFRQTPPIPISSLDLFVPPPPLPTTTPLYGLPGNHPGCADRGVAATMDDSAATVADGYFPTMWNSHEFTEGSKLDPGFTFRSHLQNETNNIWPHPIIVQRKQPQQQHSSSMVNVASVTSSSSELNLQMEPPSNQSYYNNYTLPLLPEEEKMVGMKRPWPFSLDNPPVPAFQCKYPPINLPICRPDDSSSCRNGGMFNYEPGSAIIREGPSGSMAPHLDWRRGLSELNQKKGVKENGALDGDFLTLGPPATGSSSKSKQPLAFPVSQQFPEFDFPPIQGSIDHQPFYSFLPPKGQIGQGAAITNDRRGEAGDAVDLNLKL